VIYVAGFFVIVSIFQTAPESAIEGVFSGNSVLSAYLLVGAILGVGDMLVILGPLLGGFGGR
jgi:hypothetical protein